MTSDELNKLYHVHVKGLCPHEKTEIIRSQEVCLDCDALPNDVIIPRYDKDPAVILAAIKEYGMCIDSPCESRSEWMAQTFKLKENGLTDVFEEYDEIFEHAVMKAVLNWSFREHG
jgi:hypothetical protein